MALPATISRHMTGSGVLAPVTIEPCTGTDSHGSATYGDPVTYRRAIVVSGRKATKSNNGADIISNTQVILDRAASVGMRDRVTLPDGRQPSILNVVGNPRSLVGSDLASTEVWV